MYLILILFLLLSALDALFRMYASCISSKLCVSSQALSKDASEQLDKQSKPQQQQQVERKNNDMQWLDSLADACECLSLADELETGLRRAPGGGLHGDDDDEGLHAVAIERQRDRLEPGDERVENEELAYPAGLTAYRVPAEGACDTVDTDSSFVGFAADLPAPVRGLRLLTRVMAVQATLNAVAASGRYNSTIHTVHNDINNTNNDDDDDDNADDNNTSVTCLLYTSPSPRD